MTARSDLETLCGCGCPKGVHKARYEYGQWVRGGCPTHRRCLAFEPAPEPTTAEDAGQDRVRVLTAVAEVCTDHATRARAELGDPVTVVPDAAVVDAYDAWLCEACGSRYRFEDDDHPCGALTPVTVTITRRGGT